MSDDSAALEAAPVAEGAPAVEDGGQGGTEAPPERNYLPDDYGEHYVRVKVDGEEQEVPLSEALGGYQRQADYTRKTQELANQQRDAQFALTLQRALENNPAATLRILQEQYGVVTPDAVEEEDEWVDPDEQRWREYDSRLRHWEDFQAQQELRQALAVLSQRYGQDFEPQAVVARATQMGRMDLENVYKEMAFERYWATQQAQNQATQQRAAEDASRTAAKAGLTMHEGSTPGSNAAVADQTGTATTIKEAWEMAKRQHGFT